MVYYLCTLWKFRSPVVSLFRGPLKQAGKPSVLDLDLETGGNAAIRRAIESMMHQDVWGTGDESPEDYRLSVENMATGAVLHDLAATAGAQPLDSFSEDDLLAELQRRRVAREWYQQGA